MKVQQRTLNNHVLHDFHGIVRGYVCSRCDVYARGVPDMERLDRQGCPGRV